MKSKMFQQVRLNEAGEKRLKAIPTLPAETRDAISRWFEDPESDPTNYAAAAQKMAETLPSSYDEITEAIIVTRFLLDRLAEFGDAMPDIVADLKTMRFYDDEQRYVILQDYLVRLLPIAARVHRFSRVKTAEQEGAPVLLRSSLAVALKPVYSSDFDYDKQVVTEYTPNVVGYTTVVQLELLRSGSSETFCCQLDAQRLNRFVADLLAVQAQLVEVKPVMDSLSNKPTSH
jgi:hypothetical protein